MKLSHFFQNPKVHRPHLLKYLNQENLQGLTDCFLSELENSSYTETWFDKEFNPFLETDIYQYEFDRERGYSIYHEDKLDILLMTLEDLQETFQEAIQTFLGINKSIDIISENQRENMEFADLYKKMKNEVVIPPNLSEKIYASKYVRHFYSYSKVANFIEKWSSPR